MPRYPGDRRAAATSHLARGHGSAKAPNPSGLLRFLPPRYLIDTDPHHRRPTRTMPCPPRQSRPGPTTGQEHRPFNPLSTPGTLPGASALLAHQPTPSELDTLSSPGHAQLARTARPTRRSPPSIPPNRHPTPDTPRGRPRRAGRPARPHPALTAPRGTRPINPPAGTVPAQTTRPARPAPRLPPPPFSPPDRSASARTPDTLGHRHAPLAWPHPARWDCPSHPTTFTIGPATPAPNTGVPRHARGRSPWARPTAPDTLGTSRHPTSSSLLRTLYPPGLLDPPDPGCTSLGLSFPPA